MKPKYKVGDKALYPTDYEGLVEVEVLVVDYLGFLDEWAYIFRPKIICMDTYIDDVYCWWADENWIPIGNLTDILYKD